jgi:16S rRNA (guanine527-N7)-methyltransferase
MSDERSPWRSAVAGDDLSPGQRSQLAAVLRTLGADEHAPTAVRSEEQALSLHVADSLVALELDAIRAARSIADLGSGAGFPGVALAIALPGAEVSLLESQRRKCEFLERMCAVAEIGNARVVRARVEEWGEGFAGNDAVVARALAAQPVVLEYAAPLLRLGGTLVDWRGRRSPHEERAALGAAEELGLRRLEVRSVDPFEGATDRHLHVYLKVRDTPERFPRRAGIARKRPLGSAPRVRGQEFEARRGGTGLSDRDRR